MEQDLSIYRSPYPIIYVYSIVDERHKNALKIGKASINLSHQEVLSLDPCAQEVWNAAKDCIKAQTNRSATLAIPLYAELAFYIDEDGFGHHFMDTYVHKILEQNGFEKKDFPDMDGSPQEWYICTLEDVKEAIRTIKSGHNVMRKKRSDNDPIVFREEQDRAICETIEQFKVGNQMLWNAKMRFGKTLCSLELIRRQAYKKTLIVTHRPVVRDGWFKDYELLDFTGYSKGCKLAETSSQKNVGETFATLQRDYKQNGTKYIYFASMQDLRGGDDVKEGGINKNHAIFADNWDLIIVDEAHEGTQTNLGKNVLDMLKKKKPKVLYLSGTPYNILHLFSDKEIFTWDYNMEQSAKENWYINHPDEPNDYADLPRMNIRTFRLRDNFEQYYRFDEDYFNFAELFRTYTGDEKKDAKEMPSPAHKGKFIHEDDVRAFLELMHKDDSLYPFSTDEYRELFAHTFWVVPGVKEAKALSALLQEKDSWWQQSEHRYEIVNVAGEGDDPSYDRDDTKEHVEKHEKKEKDALEKVNKAIEKHSRTITISCGRLTTGVTVKPWTGVFMLKGNGETKAAFYMQTIFRAQSPCKEPFKTDCYAFDFAPDRTLTVIDEYLSSQPHNKDKKKRPKETIITEFLKFCSVISIDGSSTTEFDTREFITQVNRAYKECIIQQGFKGRQLYVDLYQLSDADRTLLDSIDAVLKGTSAKGGKGKVTVTHGGTNPQDGRRKGGTRTTKGKNFNAERKKQRDRYQLILDTLSVRLPMMIFGEVESIEKFSMDAFIEGIQKESWEVFMPKGITRKLFRSLLHLYNTDAILASFTGILTRAHDADELPIAERAAAMADLLATFHFPDKETVLTPWRVVNLHMTDTLGGYDFFDEKHAYQLTEPRFVPQEGITEEIFSDHNTHILEINAKSGVYPLWLAYTFFRYREKEFEREHGTPPNEVEQVEIWRAILRDNIFVLCMSPMAVKITERALRGYHDYKTNCKYQPRLLEILKKETKQKKLVKELKKYSYWGIKNMEPNKFEFKAVVGNPPYQDVLDNQRGLSSQLFPAFIQLSISLNPEYASLITPSRWFTAEAQDGSFVKLREFVRKNNHFLKVHHYVKSKEVFRDVEIAGGVNYYLWANNHIGLVNFSTTVNGNETYKPRKLFEDNLDIILSDARLYEIIKKVKAIKGFKPIMEITTGRDAFGINGKKIKVRAISSSTPFPSSIELFCAYEEIRYIKRNKVLKMTELIDKWKVFTSKGNGGAGVLDDSKSSAIIGRGYIGAPGSVCTDSLLPFGCFDTEEEALALQKYMKTKFYRFMVGILKTSQNLYQVVYKFVPLQDFTKRSDIDWNKAIPEIDQQLYAKYNLSKDEIALIEKMIKPMD